MVKEIKDFLFKKEMYPVFSIRKLNIVKMSINITQNDLYIDSTPNLSIYQHPFLHKWKIWFFNPYKIARGPK